MAATKSLLFASLLIFAGAAKAAVLADDRMDMLYHSYDGGGAVIDGPSILVRKSVGNQVSLHANYYVDTISSASIDVEATASPYAEERTEYTAGIDYLNEKSILSLSYTNSTESDYEANSYSLGITHDFFGDLTTVGLGLSFGDNEVGQNGNTNFAESSEQRRYKLSINQILTKSLILNLVTETVIDDGYLNNPYRQVRFLDPSEARGYSYEAELYPETRNSDAVAVRAMYYLPYRASIKAEYRSFSDSWDIESDTSELRYVHPFGNGLMLELKYRTYSQTSASFYQDIFAFSEATTVRARDKELSEYSYTNIGLGLTYEFKGPFLQFFNKGSVNLYWDRFEMEYDNFRDVTQPGFAPGEEPLYTLEADVIRFFWSLWY